MSVSPGEQNGFLAMDGIVNLRKEIVRCCANKLITMDGTDKLLANK